jgi:small subunit ribosomal protein S15
MSLTTATKQEIIKEFAIKDGDTGSSEVQIALMTARIKSLTEHFKAHKKDFNSRRGLLVLIGQRKSLINYIKRESPAKYEELIKKLGIRK